MTDPNLSNTNGQNNTGSNNADNNQQDANMQPDMTQSAAPQFDDAPQSEAPQSASPQYGTPSSYTSPQSAAMPQSNNTQYSTPQYDGASNHAAGFPQQGAPQYNASQQGAPQYGTPQYNAAPGAPLPQGTMAYGYGPNPTAAPALDHPYYGCPFPEACKRFFKKYATFTGRASRSEFWWPVLMYVLVDLVLSSVFVIFSSAAVTTFSTIWLLACIVPFISVGIRRLHDTNKPGVWILLPAVSYALAELIELLWLLPIVNKIMSLFTQLQNSYMSISSQQLEYLGEQILQAIAVPLILASILGLVFLISTIALMVGRTNPAGMRFDMKKPAAGMPMNAPTPAYATNGNGMQNMQTPYQNTQYGQQQYGQMPYGQTSYGQTAYGQADYGQMQQNAQMPYTSQSDQQAAAQPQYGNPYAQAADYQQRTVPQSSDYTQSAEQQASNQQSSAEAVTPQTVEQQNAAQPAATSQTAEPQHPANPFDPRPEH